MKTDETNWVRNPQPPPKQTAVEERAPLNASHPRTDDERQNDAFELWRLQRARDRDGGGGGHPGHAEAGPAARYRRGAALADHSDGPHAGLADLASIHGIALDAAPESVRRALEDMAHDMAEQHRALEDAAARIERLEAEVERDSLTGLMNRAGFAHEIDHVRSLDTREGGASAVAVVRFPDVETVRRDHGRAAADTLLRHLGGALAQAAQPGEILGVLGEGEFGVILPGRDGASARSRLSALLETALAEPVRIAGADRTLDASVGLSSADVGSDAEDALSQADADLRLGG